MKKGIDISTWQGQVDFEKVKASGVEFVMLRAGYGQNNIDTMFHQYAKECTRLGIPFGVYWFSYAYTVEMARKEAQYCLAAIKPYKLDYPVAWDYEYDSTNYMKKKGVTETRKLITDMALVFAEEVKAAGYKEMVYLNPDYLNNHFDSRVAALPLWIAQWPQTPNLASPPANAKIWQYTSSGKVNGINGNVDLDVCYVDYEEKPAPAPAAPAETGAATNSEAAAMFKQALDQLTKGLSLMSQALEKMGAKGN